MGPLSGCGEVLRMGGGFDFFLDNIFFQDYESSFGHQSYSRDKKTWYNQLNQYCSQLGVHKNLKSTFIISFSSV